MRTVSLALPLVLSALPVAARDCDGVGPIIAIRADGVPVYTHQDPEVYQGVVDSVRDGIGDRPADKPILAIDTRNNGVAWVDRTQLKQFVDMTEASLRESLVYKGPSHCRPRDIPWEFFDPAEPGQPPIELPDGQPTPVPIDLFPDESIGPRNGLWRAVLGPRQIQGCPAAFASALSGADGGLVGLADAPRRMQFASPFNPNTLDLSKGLRMTWVQEGPGEWSGEALPEIFGQFPATGTERPQMIWRMQVVNPDLILVSTRLELILPPVATAMLGIGPDGCSLSSQDRWERVGD